MADDSPPTDPQDLPRYLLGRWRLARHIRDRRDGRRARLLGEARLDPVPGAPLRAVYEESGTLWLDGQPLPARQRYLYDWLGGARARVAFADGRPFHDLDLAEGVVTVAHACGADLYRGRYRLLGPDRWRLLWRVVGPRKDLVLATVYRRTG